LVSLTRGARPSRWRSSAGCAAPSLLPSSESWNRPVSAPQACEVGEEEDYTGRGPASAPHCAGLPSCGRWRNGVLPEPPGGLSFDTFAVWGLSSEPLQLDAVRAAELHGRGGDHVERCRPGRVVVGHQSSGELGGVQLAPQSQVVQGLLRQQQSGLGRQPRQGVPSDDELLRLRWSGLRDGQSAPCLHCPPWTPRYRYKVAAGRVAALRRHCSPLPTAAV